MNSYSLSQHYLEERPSAGTEDELVEDLSHGHQDKAVNQDIGPALVFHVISYALGLDTRDARLPSYKRLSGI